MRSHQKWWYISEADEEEPGSNRDIDYYHRKLTDGPMLLPPTTGWLPPQDEVKGKIIATLEKEYKELAAMEFDRDYAPTGELVIDDATLQEMLAPYKTLDGEGASGDAVMAPLSADGASQGEAE